MNHILITGASGAIGSALVPRLLAAPENVLHLVLRAPDASQLENRRRELVAYWSHEIAVPEHFERIRAYAGDVTLPNFGLSAEIWSELRTQLTHLVHAAGNVKLNQTLEDARRSAVEPTRHALAMIRECLQFSPEFRKAEVLSTIGVAGRMPGLIPERELTEPREFHNTYEQAKAEAETLLWDGIREGLPLTIHRPSMVVGDSQTGRIIRFQVFYYLLEFLSGKQSGGILPRLSDATLDIVPVDFVASGIATTMFDDSRPPKVMHLCSGGNAPLLAELSLLVRDRMESAEISVPSLRYLPRRVMLIAAKIGRRFANKRQSKALANLPYFLTYLQQRQIFESTSTQGYLHAQGVPCPFWKAYLPQVIDHYLEASRGIHATTA